jgi:hypothetical protein
LKNVFLFSSPLLRRQTGIISEDRFGFGQTQDFSPRNICSEDAPHTRTAPPGSPLSYPVDGSGSPTKKRGLVLRSKQELEEFRELFVFEKLLPLLEGVDKVNPSMKKSAVSAKQGEDVLAI